MKKTWIVQPERAGNSIRDFLTKEGQFSRQLFKRVKADGKILINGRYIDLRSSVKEKDDVTVLFPSEQRGVQIRPVEGPVDIVYEDEDILVIDKPPGLAVLPPLNRSQPSLANYLLHYYDQHEIDSTVHIVTRLDRHTSGLMVVAKHAYAHMLLTKKRKLVSRNYKAIVHGIITEGEGVIEEPIGREEGSIIRRKVDAKGKDSTTVYKVERRTGNHTLVHLQLLTGRTHQIRVHMSHMGHPLVGDTLYGGDDVEGLSGQALHCHKLIFNHPWTKEPLEFTTDIPEVWNQLK